VYTKPTEPRSIGGVLDDGLRLWRDSLPKTWPLALLAQLVVAVPFALLAYKLPGMFPVVPTRSIAATNVANAQALLALFKSPVAWLTYLVILVLSIICYTAIVVRIASVAVAPVLSLGQSFSSALRLLPRLLGQFLLLFLAAIVVGFAMALLGGIGAAIAGGGRGAAVLIPFILFVVIVFVFGRLFLASVVLMLDDAGPAESIGISWRLTRGYWWRCAGLLLVLFIIGLVFSLVVGFVSAALGAALGAATLLATATSQLVGILANAVLGSLFPAVLIAIFYDLKLRKQGGDLLGRVDALARQ
jgi:hypothetical protein